MSDLLCKSPGRWVSGLHQSVSAGDAVGMVDVVEPFRSDLQNCHFHKVTVPTREGEETHQLHHIHQRDASPKTKRPPSTGGRR